MGSYIAEDDFLNLCMDKYNIFMENYDWKHDFQKEFPKSLESEASWLSQFIFKKLFETKFEMYIEGISKMSMKMNDSITFSFDLMNNPKPVSRDFYRIGSNAEKQCPYLLEEWKAISHTIGNFAPIPNLKKKGRHLQLIHNDKNERWDFLLVFCRENWEKYSCSSIISYNEYMKLTCQQIYFQEIYDDLVKKLGDRNLVEIDEQKYCEWIEEWNKMIDKKKSDLKLLSFGEKSTEMKDIEDIVKIICILIQVRGHMILASLSKR